MAYVYYKKGFGFGYVNISGLIATFKLIIHKALNLFSSIVKSRSNLFLEPISSKQ